MSRFIAPHRLASAHLAITALVLIWDLYTAGRIAKLRAMPRLMAFSSALGGLLLVPALTAVIVSGSITSGRTLSAIGWVWPVTVTIIAAQALYAAAGRMVAPPIGVTIAAFDLLLAIVATGRYLLSVGLPLGASLTALVAAQTGALTFSAQPLALLMPWYLYPPIVAPAAPARPSRTPLFRTLLAAVAAAWGTLIVTQIPAALRAVRSYDRYATARLQERPDSGFAVGLKVFPTLTGAPSPLALQNDLSLADSVGAGALSLYLAPRAIAGAVLDSLSHALEDARTNRRLIVALDLGAEPALPPGEAARYFRRRVADLQQIARRLHPDYLVPAIDPVGSATRALGYVPLEVWITYLREAASAIHHTDPAVRVMLHVGGFSPRDSTLYTWATSPGSPIDAIGLSFFPWLGGAETLDARLRRADTWMHGAASRKEHWVLEAGGFPLAHGERAQARALWGTLAWASARPAVRGVIVYEASDYRAPLGLRAATGRLRPATLTVKAAIAQLAGS
jgi:hypothetical protein